MRQIGAAENNESRRLIQQKKVGNSCIATETLLQFQNISHSARPSTSNFPISVFALLDLQS